MLGAAGLPAAAQALVASALAPLAPSRLAPWILSTRGEEEAGQAVCAPGTQHGFANVKEVEYVSPFQRGMALW